MKAVVTGHSRGLGAAITRQLVSRGIAVLGLARSPLPLAGADGARLCSVVQDLADSAALSAWLEGGTLQRFAQGSQQVLLVNNAGTVHPVGNLGQQDVTSVATAVAINIAAPLMLAAAVAALPVPERRILHVSSGAGSSAYPGWSVYGATKAALDHHARAAALDGMHGLAICSLAPGVIDTDMQADIRASRPDHFPNRQRFVDLKQDGQLTSPVDCAARLVDYLLAPQFGRVAVDHLRRSR